MRSHETFNSSYVALLADIWNELEAMLCCHYASDAAQGDLRENLSLRLQALLLEIEIVSDTTRALRSRGLLTSRQESTIHALIAELREVLDFDAREIEALRIGATIARAQNRVFDEVQRVATTSDSTEIAMAPSFANAGGAAAAVGRSHSA